MKRIVAVLVPAILMTCLMTAQTIPSTSFEKWSSDKYSMFIHFGLYSHLGGVWDGEPVRQGYSEQIQSFAGIFSDWYGATAYEFNPVNFNADEIALLAKAAGMRSIIFTSKHHDGFCMFDTSTTDYDSMDMLNDGRDFVRELSQACLRHDLKFGLYYSLIDWHYPYAYPVSSHNADFITEQHHEFSKAQIRELLTRYGNISELWFDMGSLEPWQSREMYDLVKSLQPECMVSGRLGNDVYDFAVMADNKLPQTTLHAPWQSAASMFPETWSYRSWQDRGDVAVKVAEKLRSLIDVVSGGGNYLLNIGPAADGSVVDFERDVLLSIGSWLNENGEAVYGCQSSPFDSDFAWGDVTVKGNVLNLLLSGACPSDGYIRLPLEGGRLRACSGAKAWFKKGECVVAVGQQMYADPTDVYVISLTFDRPVAQMTTRGMLSQNRVLSWENAAPAYSYSCFDYYSNYRSTVAYSWNLDIRDRVEELELLFTADEQGREIVLNVDGCEIPLTLSGVKVPLQTTEPSVENIRFGRIRGGVFDVPASWENMNISALESSEPYVEMAVHPFSNYIMSAEVNAPESGLYMFEVTSGNGVEVVVNGRPMTKHLNPYRTIKKTEKVLINLPEGHSDIIVRGYNRFEKKLVCGIESTAEPSLYSQIITLPSHLYNGKSTISVKAADNASVHTDCNLHNLRIKLR